uniref:RAVE complex protein Rav1 C-terminal domain-containing protein n=1 Tax=Arcella intermedia TaxID=1963864 RepID=A0A6B2KWB7_9EUKA
MSNFVDAEKKNKKKSQKNNAEKKKPFISTLPLRSVFKNVIEAIEKSETEKPPEVEEQPSEKKPKAEEKSDDSSEDSSKKIKKKKKKEDSDNYDAGFNDTFAFSKPQVVDDSDKYDFLGSAANDKEDSDISISMSDLDTDSDEEKKKKKKKKDKGKKKKKSLLDSSDEDEPSSAPPVEEIKLASSEKPLEDKYRNSTSLFENDNIISPDECNQLQEILTTYRLPDVSSNEQLYLVAILETLTKVLQEGKGLVDKCGVKFVLMTKIFNFFCKSAPPHLRPKRLGWLEMAWGLHADAHPTLVQQILPPDALWPVVSALGLPLWVRDHETIVSVADTLAKNHYTLNKNPNDCAIFYIALGRLAPLSKLFRVVKEDNIANFLDNDFTQKKFKDAALKNAYRLMGQHKFEMAAAFFVLGDSLSNALNVCIEKLDDFILGLFIARLVEKGQDGKFFKSALNDWVLPRALLREERELASIAYWLLKEYSKAVEVLVPKDFKTTEIGEQWICKNLDKKPVLSTKDKEEAEIFKPGSLHLFEFLCKSRMIQNRNLKFTHLENELYRRSFYAYDRNGCSVLAYEKKLLQDLSERSKTKQINEPKKFSIASYLQSKIHGSDSSEETTEVVEKPESALVSEIEKEMLFKSVISFLCKHIMEMQERALLLGARAVVAGTIHKDYNQDTFFNILTDDWALLSNYLSIPSDELLRSITAFCTSQGYIREHYFLLKYHKMNSQVGSFLVNEAHKITNTGLRYLCSESFLMSVSGKNSEAELTTAQSRRLEVLSRHLHGCLIDYLTPEQNFDEDEDDEKETLPPPEGSGLESKEGDKVLKSEEKKKEIMVPDLAMNDQLMVNIACRFGVFAAAWSQHDFLTLLELSYGKSMDILTKDQVSPMYVEDTSDQIQEESMPRSDSEVKKETMDYVKKLLLLLIRYQFIYMLENQYCTASIIHNLKVSQFALEKSLRNVPEQLYTEFRQVNKNMKNDFDETTFILNFVKKNHIFETGEDDKFGLMCQESALSLIEDSVIKKYLTQLSLMKNYHLSQPTHQTEEDQVELLVKLGAPSHHIYTDSITCQFSPPETIYHYKELIHCFDINPQNPNIIVFGTNSGTIEVDISAPSDIVTRELSANTLSVQKPTKEKSAKGTLRKSNSTKSVDKKTKEDGSLKTSTTNIPNLSSPRATNPAPTQVQFSPEHQATVHTAISTTPNPLSRSQSLFPRSGVNSGAPSSATPPSPSSRKPTAKELAATQTMRTMNSSTGGVPRVPNLVKYTAVYSVSFHPTKPYYISGSVDGHIQSYLHKSPSVVTTYKKLDCRVHKIKFNESGSKFGVCDHSGKVSLFRWTENKEASPYRVFQCHSGRCTDMIFLNLGSFFATVGHSHDKSSDNIQFWDSLLPEPKANVWSCPTNIEGGSSSLVFSPKQQILFVGFKKGAISAIDVKQRQTLFTIDAHVSNCRSLVVDPNCRYLVSGSTDGGIKVWDINKSIGEGTLMPLHTWPEVHKQQTFLRPLTPGVVSTYGVTEIRLINGSLFSCGSDGRIVFLPIV